MVRLACLVLLALAPGGCAAILGLDSYDPDPILCGPYGPPMPVQFDSALVGATDFSVAGDGIHGMVYATYNNIPGPMPIVFDAGRMTWVADSRPGATTLQMTMTKLAGAHLGVTGDAYGWIDHVQSPSLTEIDHFMYTGSTWAFVPPPVTQSNQFDLIPGNEVEADAGSGTKTYYLVYIKRPFFGVGDSTIELVAATPPSYSFISSGFVDPLNSVAGFQPTGGALTRDHQILVYTGKSSDGTGSHLYETKLTDKDKFEPGHVMSSLYVAGQSDDQPWVNDDTCSRIWFRRDGVTYTAQTL